MLDIGIQIPEDYVTQKGCLLGVTGTGKSNGLGVMLEEFEKKKLPYVCLDVLGAHYGIAEKYLVAIFGGSKGVNLDKINGSYYADLIFRKDLRSVIFDLSEWNDFEMQEFAESFLNRMFELHAEYRVPRHIFVEEAEVFFPQTNYDSSKGSLMAGNRIMKRGRTYGLGMTLVSQRPQDVNKKTLSQSQANFLLHLEGVQEIEVVNKLLKSEEKEVRQDLLRKVSRADKGECLVYSPQWLKKNSFFKFRKRETFHAGYTPALNEVVEEPNLLPNKALGSDQEGCSPAEEQQYDMKAIELYNKASNKNLIGSIILVVVSILLIGLVL